MHVVMTYKKLLYAHVPLCFSWFSAVSVSLDAIILLDLEVVRTRLFVLILSCTSLVKVLFLNLRR